MSQDKEGRHDRPVTELDRQIFTLISDVLLYAGTGKDRETFDRLAIILTRPIKKIARAKLELYLHAAEVNSIDIDQIANATLLRFFQAIPRLDPRRSVFPWLAKMISRLAIDWIREERGTRRMVTLVPLNEDVYLIAAPAGDGDERLIIERWMEGLAPTTRELVLLTIEGQSAIEIAKRMHETPWWVRKQLRRLRPQLRSLLAE